MQVNFVENKSILLLLTKISTEWHTIQALEFPLSDLSLNVCGAILVELCVKVLREDLILIPPALDVVYNAVSEGMPAAIISLVKYFIGSVGVLWIVKAVKVPAVVPATHEALKQTEYL